jgi:dCMP deaminase
VTSPDRIRPPRDFVLLAIAQQFSRLSTCSRKHVGAVFTVDSRVVSSGYNGAPAGMPHCDHSCNCPGGSVNQHYADECRSLVACTTAIHAEANALADAARRGVKLEGSVLYVTMAPCLPCSQLIVSVGISEMIYAEAYRDSSGLDFLRDAKVPTKQLAVWS